jgi:hypothetical protein
MHLHAAITHDLTKQTTNELCNATGEKGNVIKHFMDGLSTIYTVVYKYIFLCLVVDVYYREKRW